MSTDMVVQAQSLVKRYGDFEAVRGVSFAIARGECFAMLGPNGAGKSSTIRMICCLSPVSDGTLHVLGTPASPEAVAVKQRLGIVSQDDYLDPTLTVLENVFVHGRLYRLDARLARQRAQDLLEFVQLDGKMGQKVSELSGGMRRRLAIARALIGDPELLILDEPTTGLDPQARLLVWGRLLELRRQGVTILLSTHYMDEAERLADRLIVMDHGTIQTEGQPLDVIRRFVGDSAIEIYGADEDDVRRVLAPFGRIYGHGDGLVLYPQDPAAVEAALQQANVQATRLIRRSATLEDVFLNLTGRGLREE